VPVQPLPVKSAALVPLDSSNFNWAKSELPRMARASLELAVSPPPASEALTT
jgi:hypothetical protein